MTTSNTTITLPVRDLHNAVKNIMHFAPKGLPKNASHLPLDGAHLTVRRGALVLEATDTAKMMQINVSFDHSTTIGEQKNGTAQDQSYGIIGIPDLKDLELWLRDAAKIKNEPYPMVELVFDDTGMTARHATSDETTSCELVTSQRYPNVDKLLIAFDFDKAPSQVINVYNPAHLKVLTAVSDTRATRRKQSISLTHHPKRRAVAVHWIAEGQVWAQGLLMPLIDPGVDLSEIVQF